MFQYATARALAHRNKTNVKLDLTLLKKPELKSRDTHRDFELGAFKIKAEIASPKEVNRYNLQSTNIVKRVMRRLRNTVYNPCVYIHFGAEFQEDLLALENDSCIVGSFQSEKYFSAIESTIREEFSFKDTSVFKSNDHIHDIRATNSVAVHIRRGDYVENEKYSKTLGAKGLGYYEKAFEVISQKVPDPVLFVFSDDIAWCKAHLKAPFPVQYVSDANKADDAWKDLLLLSSCKHFIIPNSTFGWWGAWLGNADEKIVLAPAQWSANGTLDSRDRIPDRWITI